MSRRVGVGRSVGQVHFDPMSKLADEENDNTLKASRFSYRRNTQRESESVETPMAQQVVLKKGRKVS